jgi:anti-sigma factor RsiW
MDDTVLMAYVDGELPPKERHEVEKQMAASPEVAERVALFEASRLPYREAFAQQKLPPVPERLAKTIEEWVLAQAAKSAGTSANEPAVQHGKQFPASTGGRSRLRVAPAWLAVAFVAGAFFTGGVLRFAPGLPGGPSAPVGTNEAPWVQAVVGYQQLYSRETLLQSVADVESPKRIVEAIRRDDGLAIRIPDLREAGLTFKRVQRLSFHGRPLIQIEYLPERGAPIALCIIKQVEPDQPIASQRIADMNVVTWRQSELAYALLGSNSGIDLASLGRQISDRSTEALF